MKIQLDGTNIKNKGAELMLYAVLEEVERYNPNAYVFWNDDTYMGNPCEIHTNVKFDKSSGQKWALKLKPFKISSILRRLHLPYRFLTKYNVLKGVDAIFDASGFHYSDQFKISSTYLIEKERYYKALKKEGTKIILLPQAFGPFETVEGKKMVALLSKYCDLIFARDSVSYSYLEKAGGNMSKVVLTPDFTSLAKYEVPNIWEHVSGGICVIPNKRMVDKGASNSAEYTDFLKHTIQTYVDAGERVFLLNHEGADDLGLCLEINNFFNNKFEVITGLTAGEVKGVISISKVTITSRFHGVASALNTTVPCLATSWSHKYQKLFEDFGQTNCLLDIKVPENNKEKLLQFIEPTVNLKIRAELKETGLEVKLKNQKMWDLVWNTICK
jgi:polysaccharide pyruvyl transferase WcaK-like protein